MQQNKSKVLLRNWDPNILYSFPNFLAAPLSYSAGDLMMTC